MSYKLLSYYNKSIQELANKAIEECIIYYDITNLTLKNNNII